jgi:3-hydroxymyristoyl/3-hydroxydecanoyl-(acyl carrier protein) dehydratase
MGFVRGSKDIDPQEWFFKAHFYQDPVCPGSLGIESFLQLLKFAARERWPQLADSHRFAPATGKSHRWTYRGQILPQNRTVTVEAVVSQMTESPHPALHANGCLMVDGPPSIAWRISGSRWCRQVNNRALGRESAIWLLQMIISEAEARSWRLEAERMESFPLSLEL